MWKDPIVAEVRKNRKRLEESCGNSFQQIYRKAIEIQQQFKGDVIVAKPSRRLNFPETE